VSISDLHPFYLHFFAICFFCWQNQKGFVSLASIHFLGNLKLFIGPIFFFHNGVKIGLIT
ncbi:TPA: hypothetical protein ACIBPU_002854, partial [Salmonella enterica subsp. diarizonae serovar 61:l,v:z35]